MVGDSNDDDGGGTGGGGNGGDGGCRRTSTTNSPQIVNRHLIPKIGPLTLRVCAQTIPDIALNWHEKLERRDFTCSTTAHCVKSGRKSPPERVRYQWQTETENWRLCSSAKT